MPAAKKTIATRKASWACCKECRRRLMIPSTTQAAKPANQIHAKFRIEL